MNISTAKISCRLQDVLSRTKKRYDHGVCAYLTRKINCCVFITKFTSDVYTCAHAAGQIKGSRRCCSNGYRCVVSDIWLNINFTLKKFYQCEMAPRIVNVHVVTMDTHGSGAKQSPEIRALARQRVQATLHNRIKTT